MGQFFSPPLCTTSLLKPSEEYERCFVGFFYFSQLAELFIFCNSREEDDFLIIFPQYM